MKGWELEARESIRDLVARYNASGDFGRFDAVLALFSEDAAMQLPDATHTGRDAIRKIFEGVSASTGSGEGARAKFIRHFTATQLIDVASESEATGQCYYVVFTERGADHWGRYIDRYRREGERWLFQHRRVTVDGTAPGSWADAYRR